MADLVKQEQQKEMFIFARNSAEMARAQEKTIRGVEAKMAVEVQRKDELEENLAIAKKNKWRTKTLENHVRYAKNRIEFYEKIVVALKAGFQIIPDMDVDIFAIRTAKDPRPNHVTSKTTSWRDGNLPKDQKSECPPVGEGKYVSPGADYQEERDTREVLEGGEKKAIEHVTRWATEHGEVEFPFQLAKPQILQMTSEAMEKRIFDELGVLPRRPGVDPLVVGRISLKGRPHYNRKSVNFMVAWFIDLDDI